MSTVWNAIGSFWASYGTWVGIALIPTIITGLSMSPTLAADAPWVTKIWDMIKVIMGVFSVATPKDTVGTFQLPLKLSKVKKVGVMFKKTPPPSTGAMAMFTIVFLSAYMTVVDLSGCAWFKSEAKTAGNIVLNCTEIAGKDAVTVDNLAKVIAEASTGSSITDIVTSFITQFGEQIAGCAASKADQLLAMKMSVGSGEVNETTILGHNNLQSVMATHKWVVKDAK